MEERDREKIYSQRVKAGKRTYFFDVKSTRANDYYLTITESRRQPQGDGFTYEKHKMFVYKEDFNKFVDALQQTIDYVKTELMPDYDFEQFANQPEHQPRENGIARQSIDDLGSDLKWEQPLPNI